MCWPRPDRLRREPIGPRRSGSSVVLPGQLRVSPRLISIPGELRPWAEGKVPQGHCRSSGRVIRRGEVPGERRPGDAPGVCRRASDRPPLSGRRRGAAGHPRGDCEPAKHRTNKNVRRESHRLHPPSSTDRAGCARHDVLGSVRQLSHRVTEAAAGRLQPPARCCSLLQHRDCAVHATRRAGDSRTEERHSGRTLMFAIGWPAIWRTSGALPCRSVRLKLRSLWQGVADEA